MQFICLSSSVTTTVGAVKDVVGRNLPLDRYHTALHCTSLHCLELNFSTLYGIALICTALYFTALQPVRTVKTLRLQCRCHHCCKVLVKCVRVLFSYLSFFSTADHPSNFATIMVVRVGHLTAQCSTLVLTCNPTAYTRLSFCQSVTSRRPRCYFWLGGIYKYSPPLPPTIGLFYATALP